MEVCYLMHLRLGQSFIYYQYVALIYSLQVPRKFGKLQAHTSSTRLPSRNKNDLYDYAVIRITPHQYGVFSTLSNAMTSSPNLRSHDVTDEHQDSSHENSSSPVGTTFSYGVHAAFNHWSICYFHPWIIYYSLHPFTSALPFLGLPEFRYSSLDYLLFVLEFNTHQQSSLGLYKLQLLTHRLWY